MIAGDRDLIPNVSESGQKSHHMSYCNITYTIYNADNAKLFRGVILAVCAKRLRTFGKCYACHSASSVKRLP